MDKVKIKNNSLLFSILTLIFTFYILFFGSVILDESLYKLLLAADTPLLEYFMGYVPDINERPSSLIGSSELLVLITALVSVILLIKKQVSMLILFYISTAGSVLITFIMKVSITRDRPGDILYFNLFGLTGDLVSFSYPSGHVVKSGAFILFTAFLVHIFVRKRILKYSLWGFMTLLLLFVGTGQIITYRHFPSDIIGGYMVMITWFLISLYLTGYIYNRFDFLKRDGDLLKNYFTA